MGLNRWGTTLISSDSLPDLLQMVLLDDRIYKDYNLVLLANIIQDAINRNKFMLYYGI